MLLSNALVDKSQRVSILGAADPYDTALNNSTPNDDFIQAVLFLSVSSVLKQCDQPNKRYI